MKVRISSAAMAAVLLLALVSAGPASAQAPVSWTTDRQTFQVGDVISVLLDEYTLASANKNVSAEEERTRTLGAGGAFDGTSMGEAAIQTESSGRSRKRGQNIRNDRLAGEITVRVVELSPEGLLRVEGTKSLTIDEHAQEITLSGWLRPEDVPAHNVVESWRIADATIEYTAEGDLGKPKQGIITRIIGWIWP